ncbi:zinc-binding dehydrogenase [Nocardia vaccinii]|uniref:zinc-binding dehydrogenase n=1 Tax=Nocardia vaccinii TaxID=1822 RepID=UPI001C3FA445|nr:alcohol dehydrogenase catalytic domain-containing protein [Nocardia vaccinii]
MGEVLVRLKATGICHTDKSFVAGGIPAPVPMVMGHEGAGVVEEVGEGAQSVVGDHVVLSIVASCGTCYQCSLGNRSICEVGAVMSPGGLMLDGTTRLTKDQEDLHSLLCQSSLAEYAVVPATSAVAFDNEIPFQIASLLACGAGTGFGAVTNRTVVFPGASAVVIGCGGVGLSSIMALRVQGATTIIGIDPSAEARALAEKVGATHTIDPTATRALREIGALTDGRGADFAYDAAGVEGSTMLGFQAVRPGGDVVTIGIADATTEVTVDLYSLLMQKRLSGTFAGSLRPQIDIPGALALYKQGRLPLDLLITETVGLDDAPRLLDPDVHLPAGRAVVLFD